MNLLIVERFDRHGASEGVQYLLFTDYADAEQFARRLAVDYFGCPELPAEGEFESTGIKGDVLYYREQIIINWTEQPRTQGGAVGDSHCLSVEPVGYSSAQTRLDFWNQPPVQTDTLV